MKQFIYKVIIVLFGIGLIDFGIGLAGKVIIHYLNQKNYSGEAALFGYNLESAKSDIMILGSSTASCHYIPSILRDSINVYLGTDYDAFNAGAYYQQPSYSYCVLKSVVSRKVPKIVLLDIQPQQLGELANPAALKPMHPYYYINNNVREVLDENESIINRVYLHSGLYRFNTEIIKLAASFRNPIGDDGFFKKEGEADYINMKPEYDNNDLNPILVSEFEKTILIAKENNINLFIVLSPRLFYTDRTSKSYKKIYELCEKYNISILDFTLDNEFQDCHLFCDKYHLNPKGAEKVTLKTFELIKSSLIKDNQN